MQISNVLKDVTPTHEIRSGVNFEKLEVYILKVLPIENEIKDLKKEIGKYLSANKSISEIETEIKRVISMYQDRVKEHLLRDTERLQTRSLTKADCLLVALQEWQSLQSLEKYFYLIKGTGVKDILSVENREANVKRINDEIAQKEGKLKKFFPYENRQIFEDVARCYSRWVAIAPYFYNPVNWNGEYLDKTNDAKLLEIYNKAKLGDIEKFQYHYPFIVFGKDYTKKVDGKIVYVHPGFDYPGLNKTKEGKIEIKEDSLEDGKFMKF